MLEDVILIEKNSDINDLEYESSALIELEHEEVSNIDTSQVLMSIKM